MSTATVVEAFGVVRPDGTLEMEQKLAASPGRVKVRIESVEPVPPGDWDAAMQAAAELEDYDYDAFQRQRDYDLQHAKDPDGYRRPHQVPAN